MAAARFYSSVSGAIDLTAGINSSATSMTVSSTTGLPGTWPYTLVLDPGTPSEEIVTVTNVSGLTLTVTRGVDGSSATSHSAGVGNIRHMATARDFREPQEHIGASADVHGIGASSSVVGTETVQTVKNKTAQAASAATTGLIVKGAASQTAPVLDVQDSTGTTLVKVEADSATLQLTSTTEVSAGPMASLLGYVARLTTPGVAVVGLIVKRIVGQTADLFQVQNESGTVLAKFDKDGKLTAPQVTSTGPVSGTTGAFSGAITSPTITTLQSADTSLDGRVSAVETNLGSQTTFASASATKDAKKLHWGTFSGTSDASGFLNVTHGAGFTPTVVLLLGTAAVYQYQADTLGGTTFRIRVTDASGTVGAYSISGYYLCGE